MRSWWAMRRWRWSARGLRNPRSHEIISAHQKCIAQTPHYQFCGRSTIVRGTRSGHAGKEIQLRRVVATWPLVGASRLRQVAENTRDDCRLLDTRDYANRTTTLFTDRDIDTEHPFQPLLPRACYHAPEPRSSRLGVLRVCCPPPQADPCPTAGLFPLA